MNKQESFGATAEKDPSSLGTAEVKKYLLERYGSRVADGSLGTVEAGRTVHGRPAPDRWVLELRPGDGSIISVDFGLRAALAGQGLDNPIEIQIEQGAASRATTWDEADQDLKRLILDSLPK